MIESYMNLTETDILYAALIAFIITQIVLIFSKRVSIKIGVSGEKGNGEMEKISAIKKCVDMFPIETIYFRDKVFKKGAKIRITTRQKKVIEGELIGKNDMDIVCIMTGQHIVAHEMAKIEDITEMTL